MANVKLICASPQAANQLLTGRVFIANARVVGIKDTQELICCNKCQAYGHIHEMCKSLDHCALCARLHPTNICSNTNVCECVSCGNGSNHASSDHSTCPTYTDNSTLLDAHIPENTLLYFPILGVPWTFVTTAINSHTHTTTLPSLSPSPAAHTATLLNPPSPTH